MCHACTHTHSICKWISLYYVLYIQAKESTQREEGGRGDSSQSLPLIKYSVTMSAPEVVLPTSDGGAIVLDMGQVALDNKLEYKERNSVAMSTFKAKLSYLQIHRLMFVLLFSASPRTLGTCLPVCLYVHMFVCQCACVPVYLCACIPI